MKKINKSFNLKIVLFSILVISLVTLGSASVILGQGTTQEICDGKDDNGDGVVDENVNCDHYLSYLIDKTINPVNVVLRDQFINPTDFRLVLIERLLNPVKKLHAGLSFIPKRPDLHYLAYRVETQVPFTPRQVLIENQFEKRVVSAIRPNYLLAPTGKRKLGLPIDSMLSHVPSSIADKLIATIVPPIPKDANHYLCYDLEPYDVNTAVLTRDQFQSRQFEVIRARYLCNPVQKTHDGKVSEIIDRDNHIMCYEVIPHNPVNRKVLTHNQFGIKLLNAVRTEEICVPTVKTHLQPVCVQPDDNGTAVIFAPDKVFRSTTPFVVAEVAAGDVNGDGVLMSTPDTVINRSGSPETGETYTFDTEMLQLSLSSGQILNIPVQGEIGTMPRTPGDPIQSFDTDMHRLQGQLPPGDPDFDLLRITAGTGFGLPSPGHTTLMQLPGGNWNVDSFFDITYRIDFVGAPGGHWSGHSGSTTGTIRMQGSCN